VCSSDLATSFLHRDHLASIRVTSDAAGALAKRVSYRPFGETQAVSGPAANDNETRGWIGATADPETGLLYLEARFYDPLAARFLTPDWWDPSLPGVGTNRYAYADHDPVNKSDPNGHVGIVGGLVGGIFGVVGGVIVEAVVQTVTRDSYDFSAIGKAAIEGGFMGAAIGATGPIAGYGLAPAARAAAVGVVSAEGAIIGNLAQARMNGTVVDEDKMAKDTIAAMFAGPLAKLGGEHAVTAAQAWGISIGLGVVAVRTVEKLTETITRGSTVFGIKFGTKESLDLIDSRVNQNSITKTSKDNMNNSKEENSKIDLKDNYNNTPSENEDN
jgi:RHS repeat-associated protein